MESNTKVYRNHQERLMMEALDIIGGSRRQAYGPPERNFQRIASIWNGYLSAAFDQPVQLGAHDVCFMLGYVKDARLIESPDHEDSMRDRFGYMGCYVDLLYGDGDTGAGWQDWPEAPPPSEPAVDPPDLSIEPWYIQGGFAGPKPVPVNDEQVVDLGNFRAATRNGGSE